MPKLVRSKPLRILIFSHFKQNICAKFACRCANSAVHLSNERQYWNRLSSYIFPQYPIIYDDDFVKADGKQLPIAPMIGVIGAAPAGKGISAYTPDSHGWDRTEAGMLMSMKCNLAICQTVDPQVTVRAMLDEDLAYCSL